MTVIRRLDAVLEDTKLQVLEMKKTLDTAGITNQWGALCNVAGQAFCNASPFCLRDLTSRPTAQKLKVDFEAYLDGFSPNVQEILEKFKFRNQIDTMIEADILGAVIQKFVSKDINLSRSRTETCRVWIITPWAQSSRSLSAASMKQTTKKLVNTGRPAML